MLTTLEPFLYRVDAPLADSSVSGGVCRGYPQKVPLVKCGWLHRWDRAPYQSPNRTAADFFCNGHKRVHAMKFQSVVVPNGLIAHLYGSVEGRHHDAFLLLESGLLGTTSSKHGQAQPTAEHRCTAFMETQPILCELTCFHQFTLFNSLQRSKPSTRR